MRFARSLCIAGALWQAVITSAAACTPERSEALERYARGDLMTQIAEHADVIQIVRAGQSEPLSLAWQSAVVNASSFELEVVQTIAAVPLSRRSDFRVSAVAIDSQANFMEWLGRHADRRQSLNLGALEDPKLLPGPMSGGFEDIEFMTNCQIPFLIAPGDLFIALRHRDGGLYVTGHPDARRLAVDVERTSAGGWVRAGISRSAPGLIRIASLDDPLLLRLMDAIQEGRVQRAQLSSAAAWEAVFLFVFGNRQTPN